MGAPRPRGPEARGPGVSARCQAGAHNEAAPVQLQRMHALEAPLVPAGVSKSLQESANACRSRQKPANAGDPPRKPAACRPPFAAPLPAKPHTCRARSGRAGRGRGPASSPPRGARSQIPFSKSLLQPQAPGMSNTRSVAASCRSIVAACRNAAMLLDRRTAVASYYRINFEKGSG